MQIYCMVIGSKFNGRFHKTVIVSWGLTVIIIVN